MIGTLCVPMESSYHSQIQTMPPPLCQPGHSATQPSSRRFASAWLRSCMMVAGCCAVRCINAYSHARSSCRSLRCMLCRSAPITPRRCSSSWRSPVRTLCYHSHDMIVQQLVLACMHAPAGLHTPVTDLQATLESTLYLKCKGGMSHHTGMRVLSALTMSEFMHMPQTLSEVRSGTVAPTSQTRGPATRRTKTTRRRCRRCWTL